MSTGFGRKKKRQLQLESRKDKLQKLNQIIPWQIFVRKIEQSLNKEKKAKLVVNQLGEKYCSNC